MLPDPCPHIAAARRAAAARRRIRHAFAGMLSEADARLCVAPPAGQHPAPRLTRLLAWESLLAARGRRTNLAVMRHEVAIYCALDRMSASETEAQLDHAEAEVIYAVRRRDRTDLPAGEVTP